MSQVHTGSTSPRKSGLPRLPERASQRRALAAHRGLLPADVAPAATVTDLVSAVPAELPTRRTLHVARKVFHATSIGLVALVMTLAKVSVAQALLILGAVTAVIVTVDLIRLWMPGLNDRCYRDFKMLMRDSERHRLSGMSFVMVGALTSVALLGDVRLAALPMFFLAFGDPLASYVGVRWGRVRLPGGKSVEGCLATFFSCFAVALAFLAVSGATTQVVPVALAAAAAATVAEWLPLKAIDDNLRVPALSAVALLALV